MLVVLGVRASRPSDPGVYNGPVLREAVETATALAVFFNVMVVP